ncbi:hypothetical protein OHD13_28450 [Escherichia coli]|uniref:hypothetical protein n=1 Tax=Escherichia coli TaxID=562 RepID=UPI002238C148|nr:hypothetical protein [Escherichia coli]MCW7231802.1 hypothetical protein [Escherichia coli]
MAQMFLFLPTVDVYGRVKPTLPILVREENASRAVNEFQQHVIAKITEISCHLTASASSSAADSKQMFHHHLSASC